MSSRADLHLGHGTEWNSLSLVSYFLYYFALFKLSHPSLFLTLSGIDSPIPPCCVFNNFVGLLSGLVSATAI